MKQLEIFTTKTCPHCKVMKKYMDENNIPYIEKDTSIDDNAMAELMAEDIYTVPVIKYNDTFRKDIDTIEDFRNFVEFIGLKK